MKGGGTNEVLAPFLSGRSKGVEGRVIKYVSITVLAPFLSGRSKGGGTMINSYGATIMF